MKLSTLIFSLVCILFMNCSSPSTATEEIDNPVDDTETPTNTNTKPNILLIIADDVSKDAIPNYTEGSVKATMPNLQSLMSSGITFDNAWSYSVCSPTRASIITGKYGIESGVVEVGDAISTSETSLQKYINENTNDAYATAIIGKWHLSSNANDPITMGIDYYAGILKGAVQDFYDWTLTENGTESNTREYATTKLTDLAIDWVDDQTKPWFLWMGYNAPHPPFHLAPSDLHSQ
jgi:arylsulfatase A-like enzyme